MSDDAVTHWLQAAGRHPLLTPAEELHLGGLIRAWQDHPDGPEAAPSAIVRRGRRARDRMVAANLRLVANKARKMGGRNQQSGELIDRLQAGALALTRAAEKFDPARGYKFSTYAYWWIWQGINNHNLADSVIRIPSNVGACLRGQNGEASAEQLECARAAWKAVFSLEQPAAADDNSRPLVELLPAPAPPEDDLEVAELHARLARLPPLQAWLVCGRWGIGCARRPIGALAAAEGMSVPAASMQLRLGEAALRGEQAEGAALAGPMQAPAALFSLRPRAPTPPAPITIAGTHQQLSLELCISNPLP